VETARDTLGHAGRQEALIQTILTQITFDHFFRGRIPLGDTPRAGINTLLTADAFGFIHKNHTVLRPFLHGVRGAYRDTPRALAMKTGYKGKDHPGDTADPFGSYLIDPAKTRACVKAFVRFTVHLAGVTSDTSVNILG
jgi:hypothetical protein